MQRKIPRNPFHTAKIGANTMSQIHTEIALELDSMIKNLESWHWYVQRDESLYQGIDALKEVLEELRQ